jgi:uncharacterized protein
MEKLFMDALATGIEARVNAIDWHTVEEELDQFGCATVAHLLTPTECDALKALYSHDELYRSRVVMARHGFGRGEYKYYGYPLPEVIGNLRDVVYPHRSRSRIDGTRSCVSTRVIRRTMPNSSIDAMRPGSCGQRR